MKSDAQLLSEVQILAEAMRVWPSWTPSLELIREVLLVPGEDRVDERLVAWMIDGPPETEAWPPVSPTAH